MGTELVIVLIIIFTAVLVRSVFGFGDALLAMPLLAVYRGLDFATPLMAMVGFTIAGLIIISDRRKVLISPVIRLVISSLIGIPVGICFLTRLDELIVKTLLAGLIILFSLYRLAGWKLRIRISRGWSWMFGFIAGILGGAYNTNGPPVVIYGTLTDWEPGQFRATLQGYFLSTGLFILAGHAMAGLWTREVVTGYLYCLPVILLAFLTGLVIRSKISTDRFYTWVYILLIALGGYLLLDSLLVLAR
jgi:uncharacterized membrane protein YfcA